MSTEKDLELSKFRMKIRVIRLGRATAICIPKPMRNVLEIRAGDYLEIDCSLGHNKLTVTTQEENRGRTPITN